MDQTIRLLKSDSKWGRDIVYDAHVACVANTFSERKFDMLQHWCLFFCLLHVIVKTHCSLKKQDLYHFFHVTINAVSQWHFWMFFLKLYWEKCALLPAILTSYLCITSTGLSSTVSKLLFEALVLFYYDEKAVKMPQLGVSASHALNAVFQIFPRSNGVEFKSWTTVLFSCFASFCCIGYSLSIFLLSRDSSHHFWAGHTRTHTSLSRKGPMTLCSLTSVADVVSFMYTCL